MILRLEVELRLLSPDFDLGILCVSRTFGDSHVGDVRHLEHEALPCFHRLLQRLFFYLEGFFDDLHLSDELRTLLWSGSFRHLLTDDILLGALLLDRGEGLLALVISRDEGLYVEVDVLFLRTEGDEVLIFPDEFDVEHGFEYLIIILTKIDRKLMSS